MRRSCKQELNEEFRKIFVRRTKINHNSSFIIAGSPKIRRILGVLTHSSFFIALAMSVAVSLTSCRAPSCIFLTVTVPVSASFPPITAV